MKEMNFKPSLLLAALAWLSFFALCWLLILGKIEGNMIMGGFGVFFFCIAITASGSARKTDNYKEI